MRIYHFTEKDIDTVEVKHFGDNLHTNNDAKISKVPRSFFYLTPEAKEYRFKNKKCYVAEVEESKIYNLSEDKDHNAKYANNIDDLLQYLKARYIGITYNVGFDICILFKDIKVTEYRGV